MKTRVGIIFGGRSGEHEISVRSARSVIEQIDRDRYDVVPIAIDPTGMWQNPSKSAAYFPDIPLDRYAPVFDDEDTHYALIGDTAFNGMTVIGEAGRASLGIDVIFPVLHGTFGEDGTIQGLLEMADIPYVGCGVLASAAGMDKAIMKALFKTAGLPTCRHMEFLRSEWESDWKSVADSVESTLGYPVFVKPANLGSSVGVSSAVDRPSLEQAVGHAAEFDRKIIVEEALGMREIECAILGNDAPEASRPGEYVIRDKNKAFLDYAEKYEGTGNNEFVVPAIVSKELEKKIKELAITAFKAVDGSGLARVDFFLRTDNGMLLVNEINTMPGLTNASGYPKMWEGSGKSFTEVIDTLITLAIERHADRSRNKTQKPG